MRTTILEGVVGSTAYGLATPDSDIDKLAVHMEDTKDLLGLTVPAQTIEERAPLPDRTSHELGKFVALALKGNPTINELLWLDEYTVQTPVGAYLVRYRYWFVSARMVDHYLGYVAGQAKRLVARGGTFDPKLAKRTEKHGRHCWRLLHQAESLLQTGVIQVRLSPVQAQWVRAAGEQAENDPEAFLGAVSARCRQIAELDRSHLPARPDRDAADAWLKHVRVLNLLGQSGPGPVQV